MGSVPPLLSFLLMIAAGWVHRHQLIVIEFLQAENRLLKDRLRGRRIRFTDAERAILARNAKAVGRKALLELDPIVSPDTLLRWHRRLVAQKWNFAEQRGVGRRNVQKEDRRRSGSCAVVIVENSTETLAPMQRLRWRDDRDRPQELVCEALMIAFSMVVRHEVGNRVSERGPSEEDHSVQALGFY
jgi:hypothetical protein